MRYPPLLFFYVLVVQASVLEALMFFMKQAHAGAEAMQFLDGVMTTLTGNQFNSETVRREHIAHCRRQLLHLLPTLLHSDASPASRCNDCLVRTC